jgi:hypothetical protein
MENNESMKTYLKFGYYSSFILSILTIITFGFAMTAIPPAGPYCPDNCMNYPFPDILLYYPRDYLWMYLAIFQLFAYVIFIISNHFIVNAAKRLYTFLSISFTLISSTVLLIAYFTQFTVVPISVMKGESEGIALITQYNEHGLFIAMEELGYITMSIALFFIAFAFSKHTRVERSYLFEVATITINWLVIITIGILTGIHFRKKLITIQ